MRYLKGLLNFLERIRESERVGQWLPAAEARGILDQRVRVSVRMRIKARFFLVSVIGSCVATVAYYLLVIMINLDSNHTELIRV